MDKFIVKKIKLGDDTTKEDLAYWLSRPVEERIAAVETLRKEYYGSSARLQRIFELLNYHKVEYVIVGAYALAFHGVPRNTGDMEVYIHPNPFNAKQLIKVLLEFGFGSLKLSEQDFLHTGQIIQLGHPPVRIDILTSISGVTWEQSNSGKVSGKYGEVEVYYLGKKEYVANKRASGRKKDFADLEALNEK